MIDGESARGGLQGAVRTRVNFDASEHHLELMTDNPCDVQAAHDLACTGLARFEQYITKPIYAAQSLHNEAIHNALRLVGFQPNRHLIHMRYATHS
ncbi:MAG: hypothetical protein HC853_12085 [Anaerolineae bacterium]|nr:hypothetical protein [Anaerolineae bacterium]